MSPPRFPDYEVTILEPVEPWRDGPAGYPVARLLTDTGPNSAGGKRGARIFTVAMPVDPGLADDKPALRAMLGAEMMARYRKAHPRGHAHLGTSV